MWLYVAMVKYTFLHITSDTKKSARDLITFTSISYTVIIV